MKIKNVQVYGIEESIVRSGYPMQVGKPEEMPPIINLDDNWEKFKKRGLKLAKVSSGTGHDNFLKGIIVQFDLQYTQYFTKQAQRYNWFDYISSQSQMHRLTHNTNIGNNCNEYVLPNIIYTLNGLITKFNYNEYPVLIYKTSKDGEIFANTKQELFQYIISNCPMGYQLWTGVTTNYLQLKTIYKQRKNHKLEEWKYFCKWIEELPMSELITNTPKTIESIYSGEVDKNDNKIYYNTSKLKLPNGKIAKLMFDQGQLSAYFADWKENWCISELEGVNNCKSFYLSDCEIIDN